MIQTEQETLSSTDSDIKSVRSSLTNTQLQQQQPALTHTLTTPSVWTGVCRPTLSLFAFVLTLNESTTYIYKKRN